LRWLAGGQQIDLCFGLGIPKIVFYSERGVLWPTIEAIDLVIPIGLPLNKIDELDRISRAFELQSEGVLKGCIMAIDGLVIRTRQPYRSETQNIRAWCNRKGGFGLVVMAGCDINGKFLMACPNCMANDCSR
jgi:hypothetical protein